RMSERSPSAHRRAAPLVALAAAGAAVLAALALLPGRWHRHPDLKVAVGPRVAPVVPVRPGAGPGHRQGAPGGNPGPRMVRGATPVPPARLAGLRDDFITIPPVRVVSLAPGAAVDPERIRKQEAAKVDARLFQKVTLRLKAASLEELCRQMSAATGVALRAARGVGDEKVTVLIEDRPAREVMRAVARLLDYQWERTGEPGAYRYELRQDLLSQLAEQELRNRDLQAALLDVDRQMKAYAPYLDLTPDQLKEREKGIGDAEKALLGKIDGAGWGGAQL